MANQSRAAAIHRQAHEAQLLMAGLTDDMEAHIAKDPTVTPASMLIARAIRMFETVSSTVSYLSSQADSEPAPDPLAAGAFDKMASTAAKALAELAVMTTMNRELIEQMKCANAAIDKANTNTKRALALVPSGRPASA